MDQTTSSMKHNGCEEGTEVFSHHGVVLKNANYHEDDTTCNGTLTVTQYTDGKRIQWKPIAVSEVSECPEQDEWAMVDTVNQRTRTVSGGGGDIRMHPVNVEMREVKSYIINKRKRELTLLLRDGSSHAFVFQYGSIQDFTYILRACLKTRRSKRRKNLYLVTGDRNESQPLTHSFAELNLFSDNSTDAVWRFVSNLKHRPYETTLQTFSKLTDTILYRTPEHRPPEEMAAELVNSLHELPEGDVEVEGYHVVEVPTNMPPRPVVTRSPPLSMEQWKEAMDDFGLISNPQRIKEIIFKGGICRPLRFIVWKFLLGYFPWNSTAKERQEIVKKKSDDYFRMKLQWRTMSESQEERFSDYRDKKSLIEKDVNRTDRTMDFFAGDNNPNLSLLNDILMTYVMYNFDLGYVQGMSDLLSPILILMSNEVDAFWCFVGFMDRVSSNFDVDQAGMKTQMSALFGLISAADQELATYLDRHESANMFFCFRWILVLFKREFNNDDIMTLWEVLWTDLPCRNFHLLICLAILDCEKNILIENNYGFTEILKHINDLSLKIDLNSTLCTAEAIYNQFSCMQDLPLSIKKLIGLAPESTSGDSQDGNSSTTSCEDNGYDHDNDENDISIIRDYTSEEEAFEKALCHNYI
ncbi:TBC1 domain family member 15/17 [Lycorma delicatula]|uniref:TBC1 domain family member 15/17 n=1 Tax=Lycorma delicatula TaxID=130591 RepID=UPI003F511A86